MRRNSEISKTPATRVPVSQRFSKRPLKLSPGYFAVTWLLIVFAMPFAFAQSGRQTPPPPKPQPPPQAQGRRPVSPPPGEPSTQQKGEEAQDEKPLKLKADLVTVITSVTDATGNQVNDLS